MATKIKLKIGKNKKIATRNKLKIGKNKKMTTKNKLKIGKNKTLKKLKKKCKNQAQESRQSHHMLKSHTLKQPSP